MKARMMEQAKKHYGQLMSALEEMGMSMEAFMDTMEEEYEIRLPSKEKYAEEEGEEEDETGKIAMMVTKMREMDEE